MRGEPVELACPFCDKGRIQCWYIPGAVTEKRKKTASLPGGRSFRKTSDVWLVQSGCKVCGKKQEDVEKELVKNGVI